MKHLFEVARTMGRNWIQIIFCGVVLWLLIKMDIVWPLVKLAFTPTLPE